MGNAMICYLAAKYSYRTRCQMVASYLVKACHQVRARWLTGAHDSLQPEDQARYASEDLEDINQADTVVVFHFPCGDPEPSTGRHIEYGYALAMGKRVILVGPRTSVFHYLDSIQHYATLEQFLLSVDQSSSEHEKSTA